MAKPVVDKKSSMTPTFNLSVNDSGKNGPTEDISNRGQEYYQSMDLSNKYQEYQQQPFKQNLNQNPYRSDDQQTTQVTAYSNNEVIQVPLLNNPYQGGIMSQPGPAYTDDSFSSPHTQVPVQHMQEDDYYPQTNEDDVEQQQMTQQDSKKSVTNNKMDFQEYLA